MKRHDHEGRAECRTRGSASAGTLNDRLTGADGIRCAKCTRSPMNLRGPASGRYRPFGSCIHAPRGFAPGASETTPPNEMLGGACSTRVRSDPDVRIGAYKKTRGGGRRSSKE